VGWGAMPSMRIEATGFGGGSNDLDGLPNMTQVVIGESLRIPAAGAGSLVTPGQPVVLLETNVDDASGEVLAHSLAALLDAGAHDAWITPAIMKKGRPPNVVSGLGGPA